MSKEPADSPNPPEFIDLGTETVLTLKQVKDNYDALGSWLHIPTLAQRKSPKATEPENLRQRCADLIADITKVLNSNLWNSVFRVTSTVECKRCGKSVRALLPPGTEKTKARCQHCEAPYAVRNTKNYGVIFMPQQTKVICPNPDCSADQYLWNDTVKVGNWSRCGSCGHKIKIGFGLRDDGPA